MRLEWLDETFGVPGDNDSEFHRGRNLTRACHCGRQLLTRQWWDEQRDNYRLFVSSVVEAEIIEGHPAYVERRLALVADVPRLAVTNEVAELADEFYHDLRLPPKARLDAVHLALACCFDVDYLLTWNLTHLANAHAWPRAGSPSQHARHGGADHMHAGRTHAVECGAMRDDILEEVFVARERICEQCGYDFQKMLERFRRLQDRLPAELLVRDKVPKSDLEAGLLASYNSPPYEESKYDEDEIVKEVRAARGEDRCGVRLRPEETGRATDAFAGRAS